MKLLFLGYNREQTKLISFLEKRGHQVTWANSKEISLLGYDLILSFGYRFIIPENMLGNLLRPIINLHISYLPYNKGAHPNFWAHYENTQSGVSIHEIDKGIDTGEIIYRRKVNLDDSLTLKKSYGILIENIEQLLKENIQEIEEFSYKTTSNEELGTFHCSKDLPRWAHWDLTIKEVKDHE